MDNLEPITREEMLLDGQDLEPITRKEMFIKRIYDKTQVVPKPITREEMFLNKAGEGGGGDITIEQLNVTQNGTYSESGKAYSPVVVEVPVPTLTTLEVDENGTYTAPSGTAYNEVEVDVPLPENAYLLNDLSDLPADIASFTDGTDLPMASLKVAVTPYQDLHGYDAPWAGGAGKNKFDISRVSNYEDPGSHATVVNNGNGTITVTATTSTNVSCGKNLGEIADLTVGEKYRLTATTTGSLNYIFLHGSNDLWYFNGQELTITQEMLDGRVSFYASGANTSATISNLMIRPTNTDATFAPYSNICPIIGWDEAVVTVADDAESPTTSHEYTIDLDGTRYGGTLDATNGTMTVDRVMVDMGDLNWEYYSNDSKNLFYAIINTQKNGVYNNSICSAYKAYPRNTNSIANAANILSNGEFTGFSNTAYAYGYVFLRNDDYTDASAFTTAMSGVQLVYELATPITVQLAPTQVKSLEGTNNIFANCGQITEVKYFKKA